jgi:membrane fusion protein (multidrug efflux system)
VSFPTSARPRTTILALALVCLGACSDDESASASNAIEAGTVPQSPGTRVEVVRLENTDARLDLRLPGEITGSRDAILASATGGFVEGVYVQRGEYVTEGTVIARVNASIYDAQLDQAAAQLALVTSELERVEALGDLATASQLQAARTQVEVSRANVRLARVNANRAAIRAPFDGTVAQINLERGEVLNPTAPVARLVKLDPVHVTVSVNDRDVGVLHEDMPVTISVDAVAGLFEGRVASIDRAADLNTRTFLAEIEVVNAGGRLLPGMIATAAIEASVAEGSIVLPQDWLVTSRSGIGVFLDEDGTARWRPVEAGTVVHDQVVVRAGLAAGDRVVSVGHRDLADGDPLLISREGVCCQNGRAVF